MQGPANPTSQGKHSRIVTHDDFDGIVSAALCSLAEKIDFFMFTGPGSILDTGLGINQDTIVCDLPHHPAAGLWFDHHIGNLEDYRLKGGDSLGIAGSFAEEKSCARVIINYYQEKGIEFPDFFEHTVQETDRVDSFDYRDIDDWQQERPGKILSDTLRIFFRTRKERNRYMMHLIRKIRKAPLADVLHDPEVQAKARYYQEGAKKNCDLIERLAVFLPEDREKEIILLDTTGLKHAVNLIKNLAFLSFPDALAVLEVKSMFRQNRKTNDLGFSISLSPCMDVLETQKDVGEIMRSLNMGDGHRGAGAGRIPCKSKAEMLKQKEHTIHEIISMWQAQD